MKNETREWTMKMSILSPLDVDLFGLFCFGERGRDEFFV
jgi:hypothetical protein